MKGLLLETPQHHTKLATNMVYISWCPLRRLSPRLTFVILQRTESRLLSSSALFQEAATGTSEEIQPWKQQNGMNFLCSNCIVGFSFHVLQRFSLKSLVVRLPARADFFNAHFHDFIGDHQSATNLILSTAKPCFKNSCSLYLTFSSM